MPQKDDTEIQIFMSENNLFQYVCKLQTEFWEYIYQFLRYFISKMSSLSFD